MSVTHPDGTSESYTYCGEGIRRTKTSNTQNTRFIRDGQNILLEVDAGNGTTQRRYTHQGDAWGTLLSLHQGQMSRYYGFDFIANTRLLTDENGGVSDGYLYLAFGEERQVAGATDNPLRFGGQVGYYRDEAKRLYVRARHLDVGAGRWLSRDPLGFDGGWNLYAYVKADPVRRVDPSGLQPVLELPPAPVGIGIGAGGAAAGGGAGGAAAGAAGISLGWFLGGLVVIGGASYWVYKKVDGELVKGYNKNLPSLPAPTFVPRSGLKPNPAPTPQPTPVPCPPRRPGPCTDAEFSELTDWVHDICDRKSKCSDINLSCTQLRINYALAKECLRRRSYKDRRCSNLDQKKSAKHRDIRKQVLDNANRCKKRIASKNCP